MKKPKMGSKKIDQNHSVYLVFIGGILNYVGITRQKIKNRMQSHFSEKPHFRKAFESKQFLVKVFKNKITEKEACRLEKMIIAKFRFRLTNKSYGGEIGSSKNTEKPSARIKVVIRGGNSVRRMSAVRIKGRWIGDSGNTITKAIRLVMARAKT